MTSALLIIDVQQALCYGEWAAWQAQALIGRVNLLAQQARAARRPVIWVQHEEDEGPLVFDAPGWRLAQGLQTAPDDLYVRKRASDAFHQTALHEILQARGVTNLVICGMQSEYCIDSSCRRALALGYAVQLAADAHSTLDNPHLPAAQIIAHHNHTLSNLGSYGVRLQALAAQQIVFA
ncbi:cysteine hydrolase family protein [Massilia sp. W12]|uniref:cysteine hydrolase family protein n=1 Tax=Massilia sp. W12 TaxID=3126507 RepID=UPI0030CD77B8